MRLNSINVYISTMVYFIVLSLSSAFIYPDFSYYGYPQSFDLEKLLISIVAIAIISSFLIDDRFAIIHLFKWMYIIFVFIPIAVFHFLNEGNILFFGFAFLYSLITFVVISSSLKKFSISHNILNLNLNRKGWKSIAFMLCLSALLLTLCSNGLPSFTAFDLTKIYEVRNNFKSNVISEYIRSWAIYVAVPMLIAISNLKNHIKLTIFLITFILLIYLSTGGRYALVSSLFALFIRVLISRGVKLTLIPYLLSLVFLTTLFFDYYLLKSTYLISSLVIFRTFIDPAWMSFYWAETFNEVGFLLFSQSISIMNSPIGNVQPEIFVGDLLFPNDGGSFANVGVLGFSFSNLSFFGLLDAVILGLAILFVQIIQNSIRVTSSSWIALSCTVGTFTIYLSSSNLYTLLASRGFLFFILFALLFLRTKNDLHASATARVDS